MLARDFALQEFANQWLHQAIETKEYQANPGMKLDEANAAAWRIGKERLEAAIVHRHSFNFETMMSLAKY
jgi:hypothetical protein